MDLSDICNFNDRLFSQLQDPSAFDWQLSQSVFDDNTAPMADGIFDPSTGGIWQPMEIPESSIDPALLAMSDPSLESSSNTMPAAYTFTGKDVVFPSQSLNYFDPTLYAPFSPEIPSTAPTYPISPLLEAAQQPYFLTTDPKPSIINKTKSKKPRQNHEPRKTVQTKTAAVPLPAANKKQYQIPLSDPGCWCSLCTNPTPIINAFDLAILKDRTLTKPKAAKSKQLKAKVSRAIKSAPAKKEKSLKRKAREVESESESESELSELVGFSSDDDESEDEEEVSEDDYRPSSKVIKAAATKRMRGVRGRAVGKGKGKGKGKKVPKGLGIDMKGW
ncbi:MAG: hypothetical protein Q9186_000911 [Xanthomendoza sp. 1 TL-2023]